MYYLNSRYYDPEVGRFINADGYVSTGQGISSHNMFSYCLNNPVNMVDSTGDWPWYYYANSSSGWPWYYYPTETSLPYASVDEAATAFANTTYSSSRYIRHEMGTAIYSGTLYNGETRFNYTVPVIGKPHSVTVNNIEIPSWATRVATAHTHPNSNSFSGLKPGDVKGDIPNANKRGIDSYMVGPNLNVQKYSVKIGLISVVGMASPMELNRFQKTSMASVFQISWDRHLGTCKFRCEQMTWLTP